ncbi:MAG: Rieske (2Fe-2S) protein [Pseudomonadota bacterium]
MSERRDKGTASAAESGLIHPDRRDLLIGGTAVVAGAAIAAPGDAEAAKPPEKLPTQKGDRIQLIKGANKGEFVRPELIETGAKHIEAFPYDPENEVLRRKYRLNRLAVLKLDPSEMNEDTRARSVDGILVFSALCTHRACTIKSWMPEERYLRCHCHLSQFNALAEGRVMDGPARRALPMVPLELDEEGFVIAADTFTGKPGGAKK